MSIARTFTIEFWRSQRHWPFILYIDLTNTLRALLSLQAFRHPFNTITECVRGRVLARCGPGGYVLASDHEPGERYAAQGDDYRNDATESAFATTVFHFGGDAVDVVVWPLLDGRMSSPVDASKKRAGSLPD